MEDKSHAFIAVSFLIVFAIGVVVVFHWMTAGPAEKRIYEIVTNQSASGLQVNAPVYFKGMTVGHVHRIYFDPKDPEKIVIRIGVYPDALITHATYATKGFGGITGLSSIDLHMASGRSRKPLLTNSENPAHIPLKQGLVDLLEHAGKADLKKINTILGRVQLLLGPNNLKHFSETLDHLNQATAHLVILEKAMEPTIRGLPGLLGNVNKTLLKAQRIEVHLRQLSDVSKKTIHGIGTAADSIRNVGQTGNRLLIQTNEITWPKLNKALTTLNRALNKIHHLTTKLNRTPQSLIFGASRPPPGPGEPGFNPSGS